MTTMSDVARVAGVSAKTVSRVFNDDPHVSPETRERVRWAMAKLNYVPNMLARSFRAGADAAVGLAFPDIADPFFAAMTSSIEEELFARSMAVVVTSIGGDPDRERATLEALLRRQISGLIVATVSRDQSYLRVWQERTPIVFVDRPPSKLSATTVIEDDLDGSRQAISHLARHGHRAHRVRRALDLRRHDRPPPRRLSRSRARARAGRRPGPGLPGPPVGGRGRRRPDPAAAVARPTDRRLLGLHPLHHGRWSWRCSGPAAPTWLSSASVISLWRRHFRRPSRSSTRIRPGWGGWPSTAWSRPSTTRRARSGARPFSRYG